MKKFINYINFKILACNNFIKDINSNIPSSKKITNLSDIIFFIIRQINKNYMISSIIFAMITLFVFLSILGLPIGSLPILRNFMLYLIFIFGTIHTFSLITHVILEFKYTDYIFFIIDSAFSFILLPVFILSINYFTPIPIFYSYVWTFFLIHLYISAFSILLCLVFIISLTFGIILSKIKDINTLNNILHIQLKKIFILIFILSGIFVSTSVFNFFHVSLYSNEAAIPKDYPLENFKRDTIVYNSIFFSTILGKILNQFNRSANHHNKTDSI